MNSVGQWLPLGLGLLLSVASVRAEQATQPADEPVAESPGKWLVDRARDYALGLGGRPSEADVRVVLALMKAAARLEPNLPEPHRWQSELLDDLGQPEQSLAALYRYAQRAPDDLTARLAWIGLTVAGLQTIEQRETFIRNQLTQAVSQPLIAADAHRRLAEIALTRADRATAKKHVDAALELAPDDLAANRLTYNMLLAPDDRVGRISLALQLITTNPLQVDVVWQLGNLLDDLSLHAQAQSWYAYALDLHRAAEPPVALRFDLARSRADAGDLEAALADCDELVKTDPDYARARLLKIRVLRKLGRKDPALAEIRALGDRYAKLAPEVARARDPRLATELAWFYAVYDPRPDEAMRFAKIAIATPTPTRDALRAYGFAALAKNDLAEAERVLKDLAPTDQMGAVGLARVYIASKRAHKAVPILQDAARRRDTGFAHDDIAEVLSDNGLAVPPPQDHSGVKKLVEAFDRTPLEYYKKPDRFLRLTARFARAVLDPGEPWFVVFELANVGSFSIPLGEGGMVAGQVLVSVTTKGDRDRQFPHYLIVDVDRLPVLAPGQSVRVIQTIDVGPLRQAMTAVPQAAQDVVVEGILDPVRASDGRWTHRIGGLDAPPAKAKRPAVQPTADTLGRLIASLGSDRSDEVARAGAVLISLLAEGQAARAGDLKYKPTVIDADAVSRALLEAVTSPTRSPILRARLIELFRRVDLSNPVIKSLAAGLADRHWLVRLMTAWVFADAQGPVFTPVARRFSKTDPDPLVRELLTAYLAKWPQPTRSRPRR